MHNPALRACGIQAQYVRVRVPVGSVGLALRQFALADFIGINVTIPHKFEALAAVDVVDDLAAALGAVNTVHVRDGCLHGYNSDGPGFLAALQEAFATGVKGLRVMVLGAGGGAGSAVAMQCALSGCSSLVLVNRTQSKAIQLARNISVTASVDELHVLPWDDAELRGLLPEIDLIVNGTSLGMKEDDPPLLPADALRPGHLVFDMVYRTGGQLTALGCAAGAAGARYVDGVPLLLHQGAISFEHWFGQTAPLEVMRAGLRGAIGS